MKFFTYIILCDGDKYYVSHSSDVGQRFERHLCKNGAKFTAQNKPTEILWKQEFETEIEAIRREKQIKEWSRKKKENLINGVWH